MMTGGPPDEIFSAFARVSLPPAEAAHSSRTFREGKWTSATRYNCGFPLATISFALLMSALPHSKVFRAAPVLNGELVEGAFRRLLRRIPLLNRSMLPAGRRPGATSGYAMHREWGSKSLAHWSLPAPRASRLRLR